MASPECTHHSNARGGRPKSDQSRASGWHVIRWAEALYIENILIENVPEYIKWGPLDENGNAVRGKQGKTFLAFINALEALDYTVDWRIINCADYGDATIRKRLFIQARRNGVPVWPEPTHAPRAKLKDNPQRTLFGENRKPYRSAREIIDWNIQGTSIYGRDKPLSENTLKRIEKGLWKYGLRRLNVAQAGADFDISGITKPEAFVVTAGGPVGQGRNPHSLDDPLPTVLADSRLGVAEPFLVQLKGTDQSQLNSTAKNIDEPLPTITANGTHTALVELYVITLEHAGAKQGYVRPVEDPLQTITGGSMLAVVEPFLVNVNHGSDATRSRSLSDPLPTVTSVQDVALAEPFVVQLNSGNDEYTVQDLDYPLTSLTGDGVHSAIAQAFLEPSEMGPKEGPQPFLVSYHGTSYEGGERVRSVDDPLPTVATSNQLGLVEPFIVAYSRTGQPHGIDEPLPTLTTKERVGLAEPVLVPEQEAPSIKEPLVLVDALGNRYLIDIRFRMLEPHELAAGMSFPKGYKFSGRTKKDRVKQIGNAVPVRTAKALAAANMG